MLRYSIADCLAPNVTHFEPQRASVRAGRLVIPCKSSPHAIALRLKIYKVSAICLAPAAVERLKFFTLYYQHKDASNVAQ